MAGANVQVAETDWLSGGAVWPPRADDGLAAGIRGQPILATLDAVVQRHGERPATQDGVRTLSYRALWELVPRLATAISAAPGGIGPIGIMLAADAYYFPTFLACLALGRPSVLLDPGAPAGHTMALLQQTGASLLLESVGAVPVAMGPIARLAIDPASSPLGAAPAGCAADPDAPALILCTSGSTGRPKAIVHSQRTIMQRAWCHANALGLVAGDLCVSLSPPATLGGINGLLTAAVAGAATRFLDLREHGLAGLLDVLCGQPVTGLRAPPSVLRLLPALPGAARVLGRIRSVMTYGEPVLRADIAALRRCMPADATIFAGYGSTESGGMGWYPSADDAFDATRTPAGRLMPGIEAVILDEDGRTCGPDIEGELVVRSAYNALGEWREGRVTAGSLPADPGDPRLRIHRTGDRAWRSADGVFMVLGRVDRMIKVNGQRVEPAEIEAAILLLPAVESCAVVSNRRGSVLAITAYVVLRPGSPAGSVDGFRDALRDRMPPAMVPSRFFAMAELPLLPGGKVDYLALADAAGRHSPAGRSQA